MSSATSGFGVGLAKGASRTAGTTVAEIVSLNGPGLSRGTLDVSNMDITDGAMQFMPEALHDGGEVTVELNWIPSNASHALLLADMTNSAQAYVIDWNDAPQTSGITEWRFNAFITGFEPSAAVDSKLGASATFKLSSAITTANTTGSTP